MEIFGSIVILIFFNYIIQRMIICEKMIDIYVALVIVGRRTCDKENLEVIQVPDRYREHVITELISMGLDLNGKPLK